MYMYDMQTMIRLCRKEAVDYMLEHTSYDEKYIEGEVDR